MTIKSEKSDQAMRTITEVSDELGIPQHVLRFWETRFNQVRPLKRAGGRRYYRPVDVKLLGRIREMLYDEGMTIKGVKKRLQEQGIRQFLGMEEAKETTPEALLESPPEPTPKPTPETIPEPTYEAQQEIAPNPSIPILEQLDLIRQALLRAKTNLS